MENLTLSIDYDGKSEEAQKLDSKDSIIVKK